MHSTTRNTERLTAVVDAWTNLRPTKSFAGMTLEEFKLAIAPSVEARNRLAVANAEALAARVDRANADEKTMPIIERVVAAVLADESEGSDGVLYAAMGYVRKSDRRSGLTRIGTSPTTPPTAASLLKAA
ncbi:MAG TPA: hypothetical protein VGD81_20495 [Opitutaceae bacterium]